MIKSILSLLDPLKPPPLPLIAYQQMDGPTLEPINDFGKASVSPVPRCSIILDNHPRKTGKSVKPVAKSRKTKKGKKKKKVRRSQKRRKAPKLAENIQLHIKLSNEVQISQPSHETRALELRNFDFEQDAKFAQDARRRLYTPKSKRKQELYEQTFINWRPVDDFMLLSSMINVNDLDVVRRCAGFTRPFLPEEIKMRWDMFVVDDITRKHMMSRFNMLSADHKSLIWMDLPFSLAEMEVLSAVSPYAGPTRQDFNVLRTSFPEVFPKYRTAGAIEVQWKWMLSVGMLEHCFKSERIKTSTITFLKPKSTRADDEAATSKSTGCNCKDVVYPENDFSYDGFEDYEIPPVFPSNVPVVKPDSSEIKARLYGLNPESPPSTEAVSHGVTRMEIDIAKQITAEDLAIPSRTVEETMAPELPFSINALQLLGKLNLPSCHFQGFSKKYPVTEFRFFIGRAYPWARPPVDLYDEGESLKIAPKQALVEFCRFTGKFKIRNHGKYEIRVNRSPLPQGGICALPIGSILEFHRCVLFFNAGIACDDSPSKYPYANEDYFNDRVWKEKLTIVPRGKVLPMYYQPETSTKAVDADPEVTFEKDVKSVVDDLVSNVVATERVGCVRHGGPTAPPHHDTRWNIERVRTNFSRRLGVSERPELKLLPMSSVSEDPVEPEPIQEVPPSPPKPVPTLPPLEAFKIDPSPEPSSSVVENHQPKDETPIEPVTKPTKTRKTKEPKEKKPRKVREKKIKPPKPPKEPKEKKPRIRKPRPPKAATYQPPGQFFHAPMFTGQGSHAPMFTGQGGRPLEAPFISTAAPVTFHTLSTSTTMLNQPRQPTVLRRIVAPNSTSSIPPGFVPLSTYTVSQIPRPISSLILPSPRQPTPIQRQPEPVVIMPRGQARPMPSPVVMTSASRIPVPRIQRPMPIIVTTSATMPSTPMTTHTVRTITVPRPVRNPNSMTQSIPVIQGQPRPPIRIITRPPNPSGFAPLRCAPPRVPSNVVFLKPTQRPRVVAPATSGPRPAAPAGASKPGPSSVASTSKSGPAKPATQKPGTKQGPASKTKAKSPTKSVQRRPPARPGAAKASKPPLPPAKTVAALVKPPPPPKAAAASAKPPPPPKAAAASTKPSPPSTAVTSAPNQPPVPSEPATAEPPPVKRRPGRPRKYPIGEEPDAKRPKK
uniref:MCRS_N domain-containing protein n=1 Tax=Panagrellus redivivus TaxID=6233 RepID=A0A7E4VD27_PANRE